MNTIQIADIANKLVSNSGSRNPFTIASDLGIEVIFCDDFDTLKGMYSIIKRNRFIFINSNLDENMQKVVCAHEIGHDQLHRHFAKDKFLQEFMLYDMTSIPEYEANTLAAEILIDTDEILEDILIYNFSNEQIANKLDVDLNLVNLKISCLYKKGYNVNPQY